MEPRTQNPESEIVAMPVESQIPAMPAAAQIGAQQVPAAAQIGAQQVPAAPVLAAQPAAGFDVLSYLRSLQIDPSGFQTDQQAIDYMLQLLSQQSQQIQQLQPMATLGQEFAPHADQLRQTLTESAKTAPAGAAPEQPDQRYLQLLEFQNGIYRAPAGMPELARQADIANRWRQHQQRLLDDLSADPFSVWKKGGGENWWKGQQGSIEKMIESRIKDALDRADERRFFDERQEELVQLGQDGRPVFNPDGSAALSPKGQAWQRYMDQIASAGVTDPALRRQLIQQLVDADEARGIFGKPAGNGQPPPNGSQQSIGKNKRQQFLQRAQDLSAQAGTNAPTYPTGPEGESQANLDFKQMADSELRKNGFTPRAASPAIIPQT